MLQPSPWFFKTSSGSQSLGLTQREDLADFVFSLQFSLQQLESFLHVVKH